MHRAVLLDVGKGMKKHLPLVDSPTITVTIAKYLRQHNLRHFMVKSEDHLFVGPKLEMFNLQDQKYSMKDSANSTTFASYKGSTKKLCQYKTEAFRTSMAYKLELPKELKNVHNNFHVSNLKKWLSDESLVIPIKELRLDDKLNFVEEPVEVMDREVKQLK
ncbi:hypothetical protein Tco_0524297 [Tanacetum coccineum]